jgi:AbrB family looped-hinge helix DNA binding protein
MVDGKRGARLYGTVKVGDKGQVVIPAEARRELDIKTGDLLFVMVGRNRRALALVKAEVMRSLAESIMQGLEGAEETQKQ